MTSNIYLDNISVILHHPKYPENIGAAARAMCNMGLTNLIVVTSENFEQSKIDKMATHVAGDIIKKIKYIENLKEAVAAFGYVVGLTARSGKNRQSSNSAGKIASDIVAASKENQVGLLFGPEDKGLSNAALRYCHSLVTIPTAEFSSINLAQSVMIMCYEVFLASRGEVEQFEPRLANRHELEAMYEQLKDILVRISVINAENPDYWLDNIRHFFNRYSLRGKEVRIIRGLCRQINWYGEKRFQDGIKKK